MAASSQPGRFGHSGKPDDAWLAKQQPEPILEPELPIIDTHHHLWDRGGWTYLLPELLADLNTGHNIVATVFEECRSMYRADGSPEMRPVGEVEFVAGIAAMSASGGYGPIKVAQGIVGYADLALGDRVEPVLEALIRAGGGRLKGVRYSVGYDADPTIGNSRPDSAPHIYARPEILAGVARLAAHGLALDAWCYHPQLADVIALARAVPQATIVMCHVGGVLGYGAYAGKKDEVHAAWRASMAELATCPNVSVKLGGMLNRGAAVNFRELPAPPNSAAWAAAWRPYVEPCIELFGAERCNFESNFPVDKMGTGYAVLWNAFKRITAGCSATEKLALYSGTAKQLYKLG
jgi:L-fuconolactonase